ncbi:MAG: hypothetical protein ABMA00_04180 [Gemmatimonas sp.]
MTLPRRAYAILGAAIVGVSCQARDSTEVPAITGERPLSLDSLRCVQTDTMNRCALYGVSIYELVTQPREWHGRRVRVIGYAHFHDEENELFASAEDWRRNISANAVRIPPPAAGRDSLNHRDLLVEATFDARTGGGLQQVTRIESWEWMARPRWEDIPKIDLKPPQQ